MSKEHIVPDLYSINISWINQKKY